MSHRELAARPPIPPAGPGPGVPLRLAAVRGQLSLEIQKPVEIGPFTATSLIISLPGLRFPIDLSGGVARFRNRRGALEVLRLHLPFDRLIRHATPLVRNSLGTETCELSVMPGAHGLVLGIHHSRVALAFDLVFAPDEDRGRFIVMDARASGLLSHAHGAALRAAEAIAGRQGKRAGSVLEFEAGLQNLVREILIDAGARAPDTSGARFLPWAETEDGIDLEARRDVPPAVLPARAVRALEAARLSAPADEALAGGDLDNARHALLSALERAPRHPMLLLRLAEIDLLAGNRPESTLGMVIEAMAALDAGPVGARLLAAAGDRAGASAAMRRAAEREPYGRLAALLMLEAAELSDTYRERAVLLDEAVARAPGLEAVRWDRASARLAAGDIRGAAADLDHVEAAAKGSAARFEVCERAGRMMLEAREPAEAARMYQRALRYLPSSADASAGLARSFMESGDGARAVSLLTRAVALAGKTAPAPALELDLAAALADIAQDLPAAIAHARSVPYGVPETPRARTLEGRWRALLGDLVGASLAYAQAREAMEGLPTAAPIPVAWSLEAARFEAEVKQDWRAVQRHLSTALIRHPNDPAVRAMFRRAGTVLAGLEQEDEPQSAPHHQAAPEPQEPYHTPAPAAVVEHRPEPGRSPFFEPEPVLAPDDNEDEVDESRIARLSEQVQGDPSNTEAVRELCGLLSRARRQLDLFALVSARLEETSAPGDRPWLMAYRAQALHALIDSARAAGRNEEASLYEDALAIEPAPG